LVTSDSGANYGGPGSERLPRLGCESNSAEGPHGTLQTEASATSGQYKYRNGLTALDSVRISGVSKGVSGGQTPPPL